MFCAAIHGSALLPRPASSLMRHTRSSRHRYRGFVEDYKQRRLDEKADAAKHGKPLDASPSDTATAASGAAASQNGEPHDGADTNGDAPPESNGKRSGKRREYLREYLRWLWPHRYAVGAVFVFALHRRRVADDRAALHAVHHRPRALEHRTGCRRASAALEHRRRRVSRRHHPLQPGQRAQGLPAAPAEHARHALAPPRVVRAAAAPAVAQALGHEDRRHPLAPDRRRRYHHRPVADGDRLAVALHHPAGDRHQRFS